MKTTPTLFFASLLFCETSSAVIKTPSPSQLVAESADIIVGCIAWDDEKGPYVNVERNLKGNGDTPPGQITVRDRNHFGSLSSLNSISRVLGERTIVFGTLSKNELITDFYEYSVWPNIISHTYGITSASSGEQAVQVIQGYETSRQTKNMAVLLESLDSDLESEQKRWVSLNYVSFCIDSHGPLKKDDDKALFESYVDICAVKMSIRHWEDDATCWQMMNLTSYLSSPLKIPVLTSIASSDNSRSKEAAEQLKREMEDWKDVENRRGRTFGRHPYSRFEALQCLETLQSDCPVIHDNAPLVLQAILGLDNVPEESRFDPEFWKAKIEELP